MMGLRRRYQILGQLHEVLTMCLTESFILHSTQQPCKHPLWYRKTGTDQIILSHHVKMRSLAPGWMTVTVGPCGLTHRTAELLNPLWQKLTKRLRGGVQVVALVPARTDTQWWWDSVIHHEVRFIKGRLKFGNQTNSAPFPSAIVVMGML
jgi:site-specific DNA-methyltransferase (adenine-specific)